MHGESEGFPLAAIDQQPLAECFSYYLKCAPLAFQDTEPDQESPIQGFFIEWR
jgi:hypothetical protein